MDRRYIFWLLVLFFLVSSKLSADRCSDEILLDGSETLYSYGMDTTNHWWALTSPFTNSYRLIVDGKKSGIYVEFGNMTFSDDGSKWACFARDNKQWYLMTNDTVLPIPGTDPGEIRFSPNSEVLCFSYKEAEQEVIFLRNRKIQVYQRTGRLFLSTGGERIAFLGYRGDRMVVNINGAESPLFDDIKPFGFWYDGSFMYAGKNGNLWEVYKNSQSLTESYADIPEYFLNHEGNAAGYIAKTSSGRYHGVIISDEYYEPLTGKSYDFASGLALHPTSPIIAFLAVYNTQQVIVMSNTEFYGGEQNSRPFFTCDGSDFFFLGCNIDCFINVSGRKYSTNTQLSLDMTYAMKPNNLSIAYSTSSSMVVRSFSENMLYAGRMVDEIIAPRYNWRTGNYETLGRISDRLYLMKCKF